MNPLKEIWKQAKSQVKVYVYWFVIFEIGYILTALINQKWNLIQIEWYNALLILLFIWISDSVIMYLLNKK